jgi:hypothetical protein
MSDFMLDENHSMDKLNPFVVHEFSLPGGIRQTDRTEIREYFTKDAITRKRPSDQEQKLLDEIGVHEIYKTEKSPFCDTNLCDKQSKQNIMNTVIHPRRNIDYGVSCKTKPNVFSVGVSGVVVPDSGRIYVILLIILMLVVALRR